MWVGFSVHGDMSTAVVIDVYTGVQEGQDPVAFWCSCENNVRVNTVDTSCELLYVVFMDLGERVIHVPEPQVWGVRCSVQSSFFEQLHVQVANDGWGGGGTDDPMAAPFFCLYWFL